MKKPFVRINRRTKVATIQRSTYGKKSDWYAITKEVKKRDNYTCLRCKRTEAYILERYHKYLQVHHIKPLSKGGTNSKINLITVCHLCHEREPGHGHMKTERLLVAKSKRTRR